MRAAYLFLQQTLILPVIITFWIPLTAGAQEFRFSGTRKKHAVFFTHTRNLVIIPVYVNEKGPYNFILDSGVGPMIITDSLITRDIDPKNLRPVRITGLGKGTEIEALLTNEIAARIGKASGNNIPTAILKEDLLGLSNYVGMKISGLIGYYFINSFIVRINYSGKRVVFYTREARRKTKGERIPITLLHNKPYTHVDLDIPGTGKFRPKVVIDNGASHALSLETLEGKPFPLPSGVIKANLGIGLNGPISGSMGRTNAMRIGSYTFKNVLTSYPVYNDEAIRTYLANRNGNLGADVLARFNITFDYADSAMYLQRNETFRRAFEHDMSGIELYLEGPDPGRYFVNRVETGSPADEAGIRTGDEILFANFKKAGTFSLDELNKLLKSGDGRTIYLTLNRSGQLIVSTIKLKKRI